MQFCQTTDSGSILVFFFFLQLLGERMFSWGWAWVENLTAKFLFGRNYRKRYCISVFGLFVFFSLANKWMKWIILLRLANVTVLSMWMILLITLVSCYSPWWRGAGSSEAAKQFQGLKFELSWSPMRLGIEAWCLKFSSKAPAGNWSWSLST